eukprot:XP_001691781.1 predicted protein [Chlamydomonas reinhardtii]
MSCDSLRLIVLALFAAATFSRVHGEGDSLADLADSHFDTHGARLPTREFVQAVKAAAFSSEHQSRCRGRRAVTILAMASEDALQHTASLLLLSLSRAAVSEGVHAGETLDRGTVLITWTPRGLELCKQLPYKHRCVLDTEHRTSGSMGFHGQGFNALGFAKAKYILNTLADPLPYLISRGADMSTSLDRCLVFNDTLAYRRHRPTLRSSSSSHRRLSSRSARSSSSHHHHHSSISGSSASSNSGSSSSSSSSSASQSKSQNKEPQSATSNPTASGSESATSTHSPQPEPEPDYLSWRWPLPPSNIGMLYFRANAAVTRCVYSWMTDMRFEADINPKMWDQDMYGRVMSKCAALLGLRWQALDPRLFQSACFKECGCAHEDADVGEPGRVGRDGGHLPYMARGDAVEAVEAAQLMANLLRGLRQHTPVRIRYRP